MWAILDGFRHFYASYSHLHVPMTLLYGDGKVYADNNIGSAAYSPGTYTERCAFVKAVSEDEREFGTIVIYGGPDGKTGDYCPSYGVCRRVMRELYNPDPFRIILAKSAEEYQEYILAQLPPESFGLDHSGGV